MFEFCVCLVYTSLLQSYVRDVFFMEALAVKQLFDLLAAALSSEHPGEFRFSDEMKQSLSNTVPEPTIGTKPHDISYLLYRLKQNALGLILRNSDVTR